MLVCHDLGTVLFVKQYWNRLTKYRRILSHFITLGQILSWPGALYSSSEFTAVSTSSIVIGLLRISCPIKFLPVSSLSNCLRPSPMSGGVKQCLEMVHPYLHILHFVSR